MVLMTSLAKICGTSLNTIMVESSAKTTTITGVSRAVPDRRSDRRVEVDTRTRSGSLFKKALSDSTMGACSAIQDR